MEEMVIQLNGFLWGPWTIYFCLGVGLLFSILTRFLQVRLIGDMIAHMFKGEKSEAGISSFQAFAIALSGRVGTGNIAGTATAISFGGPGAVFWMCAIAFIGASTAFIESTLAQIYKVKQDGQYRGGPAYYIQRGLGWKWYAVLFAIVTIIVSTILLPGVQANAVANGMENAFQIKPWMTGLAIAVLIGIITLGGVKRIATVAEFMVPFMAIAYMLLSGVIIILNITDLPTIISLIFRSAFSFDSTFGGMMGAAISWGVRRGIYTNEAGQGTGAHAAAAAEVTHPVKQGLVQAFSIYIDTLVICTATAFMILITGMYNVQLDNGQGDFVVEHLPGMEAGPIYTQKAIDVVIPGTGSDFVAIALLFFGFATIIANYYIAEVNVSFLLKGPSYKLVIFILKVIIVFSTFSGAIQSASLAWALGDAGLGVMVLLNSFAIIILAKPALLALKDYENQKKRGKDPVFNPKKLGIKNANYWIERK
ncbi:MAG: alanine/glycine:cation symporter family protein [Paenisporosarcina sp.]